MAKGSLQLWIVCGPLDLPETHIFAALAGKGISVSIYHSEDLLPEREALLRKAGIRLVRMKIRSRLDFPAARFLHAELQRHPCDLIYAPLNRALATALQAVWGHPTIKVVGYRGTLGHLTRWDPSSWLTYFHPRLDHIVAVSDAVQDYLVNRIRIPGTKVTRIYKGHDPAWYDTPSTVPPPLPGDEKALTICFTGRIRPVKGVGFLLDALRFLPHDLNIRLLLAGDLADKKVKARLDRHEDPRVHYLGFRKDIPSILEKTDVFVMPTVEREGLARSVLEAMSRRIPCIVSDVGGLPELVLDDVTGFVVPPRNAKAIASAIEKLAADKTLRFRFGQAARERVQAVFHVNTAIENFESLFSRLVSTSRRL